MSKRKNTLERLKQILEATTKKLAGPLNDEAYPKKLDDEMKELDQVPPAPGRPHEQHDTMVNMGLCESAVKHQGWNRYCNQYPLESHIVKVEGLSYINASWISMPELPEEKYIITMAPIDATRSHFWHMVWEVKANLVVMLCQVASGFTGCSQYFPESVGMSKEYDPKFRVTLKAQKNCQGYCVRTFNLENKTEREQRDIYHIQFLLWPNYGIPESVEDLTDFVKKVKGYQDDNGDQVPMVVHCSGGLGRSGTFLTCFMLYKELYNFSKENHPSELLNKSISKKGELKLKPIVWNMRLQRHPWMVEGDLQYLFAYQTLLKLTAGLVNE